MLAFAVTLLIVLSASALFFNHNRFHVATVRNEDGVISHNPADFSATPCEHFRGPNSDPGF